MDFVVISSSLCFSLSSSLVLSVIGVEQDLLDGLEGGVEICVGSWVLGVGFLRIGGTGRDGKLTLRNGLTGFVSGFSTAVGFSGGIIGTLFSTGTSGPIRFGSVSGRGGFVLFRGFKTVTGPEELSADMDFLKCNLLLLISLMEGGNCLICI